MAASMKEMAQFIMWFRKTRSAITVQRNFRKEFLENHLCNSYHL